MVFLRKVSTCSTLLFYDLEFTTPCWSATWSLLYTLTNFRGGGKAPLDPPHTPIGPHGDINNAIIG